MLKQIDSILYLLAAMIVFFTALLFLSSIFLASDGQTFQVISGLLTGSMGAFLARVKPADPALPPPGSRSTVETITPPAPIEKS